MTPATRAGSSRVTRRGDERPWLVPVAQRLGRGLSRAALRVTVHGREHVPSSGPLVVAGNHAGVLDGPLVFAWTPRPATFLVKSEAFGLAAVGRGLDWIGQVPVHRGRPDRAALARCRDVLARGGVVGVFPEGTRGSGEVDEVQHGVATIALRAGAPVLPVATVGTAAAFPREARRPVWRAPVELHFGEPFALDAEGDVRSRRVVALAAEQVRDALREHLRDVRAAVAAA